MGNDVRSKYPLYCGCGLWWALCVCVWTYFFWCILLWRLWRKFTWSKSEREKKFCLSTCLARTDAFGIREKFSQCQNIDLFGVSSAHYEFHCASIVSSKWTSWVLLCALTVHKCLTSAVGRYHLIVRSGHFPHEKLNYVCGKVKQPWNICANYVCGFRQKVYVGRSDGDVVAVAVVVASTINYNVTRIGRRRRQRASFASSEHGLFRKLLLQENIYKLHRS